MSESGREAIRRLFAEDYDSLQGSGGYRAVAESWGVSTGVAWNMVNKENYWPSNDQIEVVVKTKAAERGIRLGRRGRRRDLFSLDSRILRWMLDNREVVNG